MIKDWDFEHIAIKKYKEEHSALYKEFSDLIDSSISKTPAPTLLDLVTNGVLKWSPLAYIGHLFSKGIFPDDIRRIASRRLEKSIKKDNTDLIIYYTNVIAILDEFKSEKKVKKGRKTR